VQTNKWKLKTTTTKEKMAKLREIGNRIPAVE
jgi:hypothetical protein